MTQRRMIVSCVVGFSAFVWLAFIIEAAVERAHVQDWDSKESLTKLYIAQMARLDANEKLAGAILPLAGRPLYHALTLGEREEARKNFEDTLQVEATTREMKMEADELDKELEPTRAMRHEEDIQKEAELAGAIEDMKTKRDNENDAFWKSADDDAIKNMKAQLADLQEKDVLWNAKHDKR